jgi:CHAT domain-containing protein
MLLDEYALLRSGLALAGFNPRKSGEEDGVLTALESAGLDLRGTQLVVLSACETGVGDVANGEGVYGLRRAFVLAGAESQLISLWKVDDIGTKEWMVKYYDKLLANAGRSDALRQTQLEFLKHPNYNHPYFWAAFILSGDWRSLRD